MFGASAAGCSAGVERLPVDQTLFLMAEAAVPAIETAVRSIEPGFLLVQAADRVTGVRLVEIALPLPETASGLVDPAARFACFRLAHLCSVRPTGSDFYRVPSGSQIPGALLASLLANFDQEPVDLGIVLVPLGRNEPLAAR